MGSDIISATLTTPVVSSLDRDDLARFRELGFAPTNKVIVHALRLAIRNTLAKGYRLKEVHTHLVNEGLLASDYSSFRRAVRAEIGGGRPFPKRA